MSENSIDPTIIARIQDNTAQLESQFANRDEYDSDYDEMFLLDWAAKNDPRLKNKRIVISPDERNQVMGAARLMIATDPVFKVEDHDEVEKWLGKQWDAMGRANGEPLHYPLVTSGLLYGEMHCAVTSTKELLARAEKYDKSKKRLAVHRAERLAERTAFVADVWNPRGGYYERDRGDLITYARKTETTAGWVTNHYPEFVDKMSEYKSNASVTFCQYWDEEYYACWIDSGPVLWVEDMTLPFIPIVAQEVDGLSIYTKPEQRIQPLLYGSRKANLWDAKNLVLTTTFTNVLAMMSVPKLLHYKGPGVQEMQMDYTRDVIDLENGEDVKPMVMNILDQNLEKVLNIAEAKGEQSTIYSQALGAPVSRNTTFSELSLLSQAGRLPLIGAQRRGSWGISNIAELMLAYVHEGLVDGPKNLPANLQVEVKLEVKMPQDKLQQANIAQLVTQGDNPLASIRWARENVMGIGDSDTMDKEIWSERASALMYGQQLQEMIAANQPQPPQMEGQGQPEQMPPDEMQMQAGPMMSPDQGQQVQGGLPPQMAGMMPGAGQGMMPQEGG